MRFDHPTRLSLALAVALAGTIAAGCANTPRHAKAAQVDRIESSPAASITPARDPVLDLLEYAARLDDATPEARAEAVGQARAQASASPGAFSYARLALAFGTPGQRRYTPDEAARYAQRALDADDAQWSPAARQYLSEFARLYTELTRHPDTPATPQIARRDTPSATQRPARPAGGETERVRALERELDEAHRKLRELADIEDRLSESGS